MQELFKQAIAQDSDLTQAKRQLIDEARNAYNTANAEIERDYQTALLVQYGLTQPEESISYKMARSLQEDFQRTYKPDLKAVAQALKEDTERS